MDSARALSSTNAAKVKDLEGQLQKARLAQSEPKEAEEAAFAGNASAFDFTDPRSPLLSDAGTDFIADTGATRHMTPPSSFLPFLFSMSHSHSSSKPQDSPLNWTWYNSF